MLSLPNDILYNHLILQLDDFSLKMLLCTSKHFMKCYKNYHKCNHDNCTFKIDIPTVKWYITHKPFDFFNLKKWNMSLPTLRLDTQIKLYDQCSCHKPLPPYVPIPLHNPTANVLQDQNRVCEWYTSNRHRLEYECNEDVLLEPTIDKPLNIDELNKQIYEYTEGLKTIEYNNEILSEPIIDDQDKMYYVLIDDMNKVLDELDEYLNTDKIYCRINK